MNVWVRLPLGLILIVGSLSAAPAPFRSYKGFVAGEYIYKHYTVSYKGNFLKNGYYLLDKSYCGLWEWNEKTKTITLWEQSCRSENLHILTVYLMRERRRRGDLIKYSYTLNAYGSDCLGHVSFTRIK